MPLADVPFPLTNAPGTAFGEGAGRLINCYAYKDGLGPRWRAVPGLTSFVASLPGPVRGAVLVGSALYVTAGNKVVQIFANGAMQPLDGFVPGAGPVTMERNNALPPDIVIVSSQAAYAVSGNVVFGYPDSVLPQPNSVTFLDGYFLFTTASGDIWATGLNTTVIGPSSGSTIGNPLSFAKAEARPDGLLRGLTYGGQFYAFGQSTIEVWQDVGSSPFPLGRSNVIPCGLLGPWAVAGAQDGWTEAMIFVASDGSVRRLDGYTPVRVSSEDLERLIAAVPDVRTIEASVYNYGSNSVWSLSAPGWTWEYNVTTGAWHERQNYGGGPWRSKRSVKAFGKWLIGDTLSSTLLSIDEAALVEVDQPLIWGADSGPVKQFPARIQVPDASFDFVLGQAPIAADPHVLLSWSHDGGARWSQPLSRSLGRQGQYAGPVRLFRLGLATHHGIRLRFRISDPVYTSFAGARMTAAPKRA